MRRVPLRRLRGGGQSARSSLNVIAAGAISVEYVRFTNTRFYLLSVILRNP